MSQAIFSSIRPSKTLRARVILTLGLLLTITCFLSGCGQKVAEISGTVKYKGKPVTSGFITMIGADGVPQQSSISEEGAYNLKTVPVGEVKILVSSPAMDAKKDPRQAPTRINPATGKAVPKEESGESTVVGSKLQKDTWRLIPPQYADVTKTKLRHTIISGKNVHEIVLD